MKRTTIFAEEDSLRELKRIAYQRGEPLALVIREALAQYVASHRPVGRRFSFTAIGSSDGTLDLAGDLDDVVGEIIEEDYERQKREFREDLERRGETP